MAAVTGTGALTIGAATAAGVASHGRFATGALVVAAFLSSGTAAHGRIATGVLTAPHPAVVVAVPHAGRLAVGALSGPSMLVDATTIVPDNTIWETDDRPWGAADFIYSQAKPVMIIGNEFFQADAALRFGETSLRVVLSRTGLTIFGKDRFGNWKSDPGSYKQVTGCWPLIRGQTGTLIQCYFGAQDSTEDPIRWDGPFDYICGSTTFLDPDISGRFLAVRFESLDAEPWELLSYDLEIEIIGGRG